MLHIYEGWIFRQPGCGPAPQSRSNSPAAQFAAAIGRAQAQLRATQESELHVTRAVGRAKLPASTLGLLFHAAEHTARHVGQIVTTAKLVSAR